MTSRRGFFAALAAAVTLVRRLLPKRPQPCNAVAWRENGHLFYRILLEDEAAVVERLMEEYYSDPELHARLHIS